MQTAPITEDTIALIPKRTIKALIKDPEKTAKAVNLRYVSDTEEGITRKTEGKGFAYYFKDKKVTDEEELLRIKRY